MTPTKPRTQPARARSGRNPPKPAFKGWVTSDADEIDARRLRGETEKMGIRGLAGAEFYGDFSVTSPASKRTYRVEIRSLVSSDNTCTCSDFQHNGLGTCKHIEAVLSGHRRKGKTAFTKAVTHGSPLIEIYLDRKDSRVKIVWPQSTPPAARRVVGPFFGADGVLVGQPVEALASLQRSLDKSSAVIRREVRLSEDLLSWLSDQRRRQELRQTRESFLADVAAGKQTLDVVKATLYSYQQEGMLHLAFGERVMLADDMGLGKTVQAIAACELLRRLRGIQRVLVVSPASLKAEWEEQIGKFTGLPARLIWGSRASRLKLYREPSFFYLCNYEQAREDYQDINTLIAPDVVILDEAQRIKNWQTKTAKHIKRLASPLAFVLTGTPLENRIDEVYSIVDFLDTSVFGPLFRFNRDFYEFDERGRPKSPKNLGDLHRRLQPIMLRRRKEDVEDELPERTVNSYFVAMEHEQKARYADYEGRVAKLIAIAQRRPLMKEEAEKLQRWLACMRMICDTPYILDSECRVCPKLDELTEVLEDLTESGDNKIIIFSEWERMLHLVRELAEKMKLEYAWHTGSVPQQKRRIDINRFKQDPNCRLFLSTDAGATGLNLQAANVVINMDLPWNPARLEQRIARAWRKHQTRAVTVINMVCENSIEHRMLTTLAGKQSLADGVLDGKGDLENIRAPGGRAVFIERLGNLVGVSLAKPAEAAAAAQPEKKAHRPAVAPETAFKEDLAARLGSRLLLLESRVGPQGRSAFLAVVEGDAAQTRPLADRLLQESFKGASAQPALELLDRATYDTIKRLIENGVLRLESGAAKTLHIEPEMADGAAREQEGLRRAAEPFIEQASKKMRMALLLKENGFASEALPALRDAVELALRAAACLGGESSDAHSQGVPLSLLEGVLREKALVPTEAAGIVAQLRQTAASAESLSDSAAQGLFVADRVVKHINEAFARVAMK